MKELEEVVIGLPLLSRFKGSGGGGGGGLANNLDLFVYGFFVYLAATRAAMLDLTPPSANEAEGRHDNRCY